MKKLILLFTCLSVIALAGCKKNDSSNPESLNGTQWVFHTEEIGSSTTAELTFQATTFRLSTVTVEGGEKDTEVSIGKYAYDDPTVTLTPDVAEDEPRSGTVDGNTISFQDGNGVMVFVRQ